MCSFSSFPIGLDSYKLSYILIFFIIPPLNLIEKSNTQQGLKNNPIKMVKSSDILKLVLVFHIVNLCVSLPLSSEDFYDNSVVSKRRTNYFVCKKVSNNF